MNCFESTFVHLTERFHGKEVYLVGSLNQSSMLAQRTQKLIQEVKPDAVMVQTNDRWWRAVQMLQYVECQEELNGYSSLIDKYTGYKTFYLWLSGRSFIFQIRLWLYMGLFRFHFRIPFDFTRPGLEMKYACEEASK